MVLHSCASRATLALALWLDASNCLFIPPADINVSLRSRYDYIVVGGGASGLVVANRLTEDPDGELISSSFSLLHDLANMHAQ